MSKEKNPEGYRLISNSQWRYLHKKINTLTDIVVDVRSDLEQSRRPKKFLNFHEIVPESSVCKDINSMLTGTSDYRGFLGRLAEFYDVPLMEIAIDEKIKDGVIAQYRVNGWHPNGKAYSKNQTVGRDTVLHEFFHHLCHHNVSMVKKKDEEEYADRFARMFLQRAGWQ